MSLVQKMVGAALVLAAAASAHAAPTQSWTLTVLPTLTGNGGMANAVNNRGDVVGTSNVAPGNPHPVLWSNGAVTDLMAGNPAQGVANAISEQGAIAYRQGSVPTIWKDGVTTSTGVAGEPFDINKSGGIVGYYFPSGAIGVGAQRGFSFQDGVFSDIGSLGNNLTSANGVNDKGVVVGYSRLANSTTDHAVVWENGVLRDLGTLGGRNSYATDINNHGVVVGNSDMGDGTFWMFTSGTQGGMTPILQWVLPMAINDRGAIVGRNSRTGHAILYEDGEVTDLSALPALKDAGWTFFIPFGINDRGWIVGLGNGPGHTTQGSPLLLVPGNGNPKG